MGAFSNLLRQRIQGSPYVSDSNGITGQGPLVDDQMPDDPSGSPDDTDYSDPSYSNLGPDMSAGNGLSQSDLSPGDTGGQRTLDRRLSTPSFDLGNGLSSDDPTTTGSVAAKSSQYGFATRPAPNPTGAAGGSNQGRGLPSHSVQQQAINQLINQPPPKPPSWWRAALATAVSAVPIAGVYAPDVAYGRTQANAMRQNAADLPKYLKAAELQHQINQENEQAQSHQETQQGLSINRQALADNRAERARNQLLEERRKMEEGTEALPSDLPSNINLQPMGLGNTSPAFQESNNQGQTGPRTSGAEQVNALPGRQVPPNAVATPNLSASGRDLMPHGSQVVHLPAVGSIPAQDVMKISKEEQTRRDTEAKGKGLRPVPEDLKELLGDEAPLDTIVRATQFKAKQELPTSELNVSLRAIGWDPKQGPPSAVQAEAALKRLDQSRLASRSVNVQGATTIFEPNDKGGYTSRRVAPGQDVAPGAVTSAGMSSVNVPTAQSRTMIEKAPTVLYFADKISKQLEDDKVNLGPFKSRWREFMAGDIGTKDKKFTQLRTDVGFLSTALMNMHSQRGGEQMLKHFKDLIDLAKQDPDNLQTAMKEIQDYARFKMQEGKAGAGTMANGEPQAGSQSGNQPNGKHEFWDKDANGNPVLIKR